MSFRRVPGPTFFLFLTILVAALALASAVGYPQQPAAEGEPSTHVAVRFENVATRSSFRYKTNNDLSERKYFAQTICGGVAIFDFDGDGKMDIFLTNGAKLPELKKTGPQFYNCLLRNKGDNTFEDVTAAAGLLGQDLGYNLGSAAGDYDNDGRPDLFICGAGRNALYHNDGHGHFKDVTAASGITMPPDTLSVGAAWVDYDGDGLLDLVVSNYTTWSPKLDKRCTIGGVEYYCDPQAYYDNVAPRLYHNEGNGRFTDVTVKSGFAKVPAKGMGISIADFNEDGRPDIFIANDTEANSLFLNKGDGTFEESAISMGVAYDENGKTVSSMGSDARDYDNDGHVDLVFNDLVGQTWQLFRNQVDYFRFVSPQSHVKQLSLPFSGWSMAWIDYDNDGWKDLYSANGDVDNVLPNAKEHDTLFHNIDGHRFEDASASVGTDFMRLGYQRGAAIGDLNNDGWPDLVVTSLNDSPRILISNAQDAKANAWLLLDLTGTSSNRDAIGAKVKLTTESGRHLYDHVSPSVGFISTSDKRVHFGLGADKVAKTIEITWPGGGVQILKDVACCQIVHVKEPTATPQPPTPPRK